MAVKHIVLLKFKEEIQADRIQELSHAFHGLKSIIPHIKALEWGTDISIENLQQGFTHVFVLTFESVDDRDAYIVHPQHQAFASELLGCLEKVLVFDYKPLLV